MSKNIIIQEGSLAKQLIVDKLKTNLVGGGTCLWVIEDDVQVGTKTITEDGTYNAIDDGYYGYSEVTVHGIGKVTGKDSDGEEAVAHTDPETGEIVIDKVPTRIEVITPPTNPYGIYNDGQTISTNGMVVKAYLESGEEYGTVPINEVSISPTTASYDASREVQPEYSYALPVKPFPNPFKGAAGGKYHDGEITKTAPYRELDIHGDAAAREIEPHTSYQIIGVAEYNAPVFETKVYRWVIDPLVVPEGGRFELVGTSITTATNSYTYDGKTVYYAVKYVPSYDFSFGANPMEDGGVDGNYIQNVAWIIAYGNKEVPTQAGAIQDITVSWPRPLDGEVLETTFEILVAPPIYGDSDS